MGWKTSSTWTHRPPTTHRLVERWTRQIYIQNTAVGLHATIERVPDGYKASLRHWQPHDTEVLHTHPTLEAAQDEAWKAALEWARTQGYEGAK